MIYSTEKLLFMQDKYIQLYVITLSKLIQQLLDASRHFKKSLAIAFDICSVELAVWMAFSLRLGLLHWPSGKQWFIYLLAPALMFPIYSHSGLYRAIHRHSGFSSFVLVTRATGYYGALFLLMLLLFNISNVPRTIGVIQPMIFMLLTGGSRALVRLWFKSIDATLKNRLKRDKLLIYGAGSGGAEIATAILQSQKFKLAGFIDDDKNLQGSTVNGIKVFSLSQAEMIIKEQNIHNILLAMPSVSHSRRNEIIQHFKKSSIRIQKLPDIDQLAGGQVTISDIKDIEIEDLLCRDPVPVSLVLVKRQLSDKVVMVTGAGGSIGSELCNQILAVDPSTILLVDHAEYNLYTIHSSLERRRLRLDSNTRIIPLLCDITDKNRIDDICRVFKPVVIYHAAAYKHVPMVEYNPTEGVRNNVIGTLCIADAAIRFGISSVVLVSTDKAVRPTNVMGASKRLSEMILQALAKEEGHTTCFSMVRFGNVLGSSGSVVPLFRNQIKKGGPITITHKEITRYFMTITEATQLVIKAGAIATGGTVFLLDMGEPVKIIDIANRMIELSGLKVRDKKNPDGDIEIQITGLRPGEKLYEELLIGNCPQPTANPRIFKANEDFIPWIKLKDELADLTTAIGSNDVKNIKLILKRVIPEYQPDNVICDFLYNEEERI